MTRKTPEGTTLLPAVTERPDTGPMKFGDDWTGIFIRGDTALFFADMLIRTQRLLPETEAIARAALEGLAELLASCSEGDTGWPPKTEALDALMRGMKDTPPTFRELMREYDAANSDKRARMYLHTLHMLAKEDGLSALWDRWARNAGVEDED